MGCKNANLDTSPNLVKWFILDRYQCVKPIPCYAGSSTICYSDWHVKPKILNWVEHHCHETVFFCCLSKTTKALISPGLFSIARWFGAYRAHWSERSAVSVSCRGLLGVPGQQSSQGMITWEIWGWLGRLLATSSTFTLIIRCLFNKVHTHAHNHVVREGGSHSSTISQQRTLSKYFRSFLRLKLHSLYPLARIVSNRKVWSWKKPSEYFAYVI